MKLKNKKTGEIVEFRYLQSDHVAPLVLTTYENNMPRMYSYDSLAELNEEWEDYEEPKEYWIIGSFGDIERYSEHSFSKFQTEELKPIGNYFETKEEAEKAVEKLKAWKRLKDKGFEFINFPYKKICKYDARTGVGNLEYQVKYYEELEPDLDLLFGGEE